MNSIKKQVYINFFIFFGIVATLFFLSRYAFYRIDLTSEKRYTLSPATKELVIKLDDIVYIKIYLDGDLPAGYKRLKRETKEILDEFKVFAGENIEYEFINPSENQNEADRISLYKQLMKKGLEPVTISESEKESVSQKTIFPGAIATYRSKEFPLQLLKTQVGTVQEVVLNNSIEGLEYEISNVIRKLTRKSSERIALLEGQKELDEIWTRDFVKSLQEYYQVERVKLNQQFDALKNYQALIVAKPDSMFDDKDKFAIDQFVMKGGKVLWLLDPVYAEMDSLQKSPITYGVQNPLNLEDMLFVYGVRLNNNLVMDIQAAPIPMITGMMGNVPQRSLLPWYYFPLSPPKINHPIVNNLNAVKFQFASQLDTLTTKGLKKTVLLSSSQYSRVVNVPVKISLDLLRQKPVQEQYNKSFIPLAVLLEGNFTSCFKNRLPKAITQDPAIGFKEISVENKMIIISDGDVVRNQISKNSSEAYPLGFDRFSGETFGNKNFLLNCVNYLLDESGLIAVRSREIKLRMLDKTKIENEKLFWQILNVISPLLIIVTFGLIMFFIRKRKFSV